MKMIETCRWPTRTRTSASTAFTTLALVSAVLVAGCAPGGIGWAPAGAGERVADSRQLSAQAAPASAAAPAAPAAPPAPAAPVAAAPAPAAQPALRTEIDPGAPDSALVVPALARPNLPPRAPWQPPDVARRPFPSRIERWRPLVRQVMAEEWQAGTLDGLAQRLDDDLILAMIQQESQGNPHALSPVGAIGLMQVMPQTFAIMMAGDASLAPAIDPDAFWDEGTNIHAGVRYLALAMQNHDGNFYWALASYNAGIGTVKRWRLAGLYAVPPIGGYWETADYAQIILHNYLAHRPGLDLRIPDPMPEEHVPGALELLRNFRRR